MIPTLIFVETHADKKSANIFKNLIPLLKKDYGTFYEEIPPETIDIAISNSTTWTKMLEAEYQEIQEAMNEYPDIYCPDSSKFILMHQDRPQQERELLWLFYFHVLITYDRLTTAEEFTQTYCLLKELQIEYIGIDDSEGAQLWSEISSKYQLEMPVSDEEDNTARDLRNASMVEAYSKVTKPTIGRIGLRHLKPIQEGLVAKFGNLANYIFIYIHSETPSSNFLKNIPDKPKELFEIESIVDPDTPYLHKFNADKMTVEEIYEDINALINPNPLKVYLPASQSNITHFKLTTNKDKSIVSGNTLELEDPLTPGSP
ncbi:hypothetical protein ACFORL_12410 [Legionella dresdenensis]|uniref:DUF4276 family protein n=1 Tax=Legionella dresdenensis TaxID=450200 RepID=A0ABV8CHW4_9GAMM